MRAFLLVVFLVISNIVSAQSLYMQSAKNSFSVFGNVLISEDFIVTGPGISYTFNASSNISLSFVILSDHSDSNVDLDGQGVELYYTYDLLNELRNDLYNLEFGLYLSSAWFDNINANNKSVGLSMSVSDRAYTKPHFILSHNSNYSMYPFQTPK